MPLKTHQDEAPTLNLTPMIDIVFLLIIFFMVGTKFTELERKLALQVPQISESGPMAPVPRKRIVNVYRDGRIELDRQVVDLRQLTSLLGDARQEYQDVGVIVRGDEEGPFRNVAAVLGAVRRAGVSDLGISVRIARRSTQP